MTRSTRLALSVALMFLAACARVPEQWRSSVVTQVPDGTPARFTAKSGEPPVSGTALGWSSKAPHLIAARGDTLSIPIGASVEVRPTEKVRHPVAGAFIGAAIGGGIVSWGCRGKGRDCGQYDFRPLLTSALGALIGASIKTASDWVRVQWPEP